MRLAIIGMGGFIGLAVEEAAREAGWEVRGVSAPRVLYAGGDPGSEVRDWIRWNRSDFERLTSQLAGSQAVVNAAGVAWPDGNDVAVLHGANAVMPGVMASGVVAAGVNRFVHVSSASVQGFRETLDETLEHEPFSPYTRSKAAGEQVLMTGLAAVPHIVIYRPTSVQGEGRAMTRRLVRLASQPLIPVCDGGRAPLPVALVRQVGRAAVHLAATANPPAVALHPWEGVTVRALLEAFGDDPRLVSVPTSVARLAVRAVSAAGSIAPRMIALARRLELLAFGQRQRAEALERTGFRVEMRTEGYAELGKRVRTTLQSRGDVSVGDS